MGGPFLNSVLLRQGDIYKEYQYQRGIPLGTRGYTRDGRVFRYCKNGAVALAVGKLVQSEAPPTNFSDDQEPTVVVTSGTTKIRMNFGASSYVSVGDTANTFAEGFLFVNDGDGEGQMVQIKTQDVWTSASTGTGHSTLQFMPGDEFTTKISTDSELGIIKNLYDDVIIPTDPLGGVILGIAPRHISANYYFWLQTWGPSTCLIWSSGTNIPAAGYPLVNKASTDGDLARMWGEATTKKSSVASAFSTGWRAAMILMHRQPLGTVMEVGAYGEYGLIDLKLAP